MYGTDILIEEHRHILRALAVLRSASLKFLTENSIDIGDYRLLLSFIREYADKHHHQKEEKILFVEMTEELGTLANNLIRHGMLVEHDLGRNFILELETALNNYEIEPSEEERLDIISSGISYTKLLYKHIDKEDNVLFPFAVQKLSEKGKEKVDSLTKEREALSQETGEPGKFLEILKMLEAKYR